MKFKASKVGRRTITRLKLGGNPSDPKGIWDSIVGFFSNLLGRLFGQIEFVREIKEPDSYVEFEASSDEIRHIDEAQEGPLREMLHSALADEEKEAERKRLKAGRDPRKPLAGTHEEQYERMKQLYEFLEEKRRQGYEIELRMRGDEDLVRKLSIRIEDIDFSVRAINCLASEEIHTVRELILCDERRLLAIRSFGKTTLREVKSELDKLGLTLAMQISEDFSSDEAASV